MEVDPQKFEETWQTFLEEWPLERLRGMTLPEYSTAGDSHTFTAWIERRLDQFGSIWGGSSFKFGVYSRKDKSDKKNTASDSYSTDYAWYSKYGATAEAAFARVKSLVVQVAEAAARGDYAAIDDVDLGEAYKWKIAFHYQDRQNPGVLAAFKPKRLQAWLRGRVGVVPQRTSELYRLILSQRPTQDLISTSREVWNETETIPDQGDEGTETPPEPPADVELPPLNLILYGPPGTGKTFETARLAVQICDGAASSDRTELMKRYRELRNLLRIRFVTFHPSFSYEEFVEGIRPAVEAGQIHYKVRAGVLKDLAANARDLFEKRLHQGTALELKGRRLFKMSLGDSTLREEDWIFLDCLENDHVCLGFADIVDFAGCDTVAAVEERYRQQTGKTKDPYTITALNYFKNEVRTGDLVLISHGNSRFRAVAEVTGPYQYEPRPQGYPHRRGVRWLWSTTSESLPIDVVFSKRLSQMTIYLMDQNAVKWDALDELLSPHQTESRAPNCVLVIDEINRANLAKTFGELITLLEPSKRLGEEDEQEIELPYSGERLSLPPNLYVIGTMNTADRSIALMDTALRRRFRFREMMPEPGILPADVDGIDLQALLSAMNAQIEATFDRDHMLGHSYLLGVASFDDLVDRFTSQIIPLLQEYFFEDWAKIQKVFNDVGQPAEAQIVQNVNAEGNPAGRGSRQRYRVNPKISPAAIQKIYS